MIGDYSLGAGDHTVTQKCVKSVPFRDMVSPLFSSLSVFVFVRVFQIPEFLDFISKRLILSCLLSPLGRTCPSLKSSTTS